MTNAPTNKVVADLIVSPTDTIVIGLADETAYLGSVADGNQVATIGDLETSIGAQTAFVVAGGTSGTQPTFDGSPIFTGSYVRIGQMVHFRIDVDMDNITSFGTGQYYLDLPFPAKYSYQFRDGCLHDISTTKEYAIGGHVVAGSSRMYLSSTDTQSGVVFDIDFTYNTPVTLATADNFHIAGTYITNPA